MIPTIASVQAGHADEDAFRAYLQRRGWLADFIGQRTWSDALCVAARQHMYVRHMPDLVVGKGSSVFLVDVVNTNRRPEPFLEVAKLQALTWWSTIAPVLIADVSTRTAWNHNADWPDRDLVSNVMTVTPRGGSGDPYCALMRPDYARTWDATFT